MLQRKLPRYGMGMSSLRSCFCQLRSCSSSSLCVPAHRGVRRQPSTFMDRSWAQHQTSLGSWFSWTVASGKLSFLRLLLAKCSVTVMRKLMNTPFSSLWQIPCSHVTFSMPLYDTRVRLVLLCYFIPSFLCVDINLHGPWEVVVGRDEPRACFWSAWRCMKKKWSSSRSDR